jgi:hypothetical protein
MFKLTDILRQNFNKLYFEVRGLPGSYDTADLLLAALVFYLTTALGAAIIVY